MAQGFVLLRLTPGPAEEIFGITAAPMAALADGYGRVTMRSLNLRGDIGNACRVLSGAQKSFDRRAASRPPAELPDWARPLVEKDAAKAMARVLSRRLGEIGKLYPQLTVERERVHFARNLLAAAKELGAPASAKLADLLAELSFAPNDRVKFEAVDAFAALAPPERAGFLVERAARRTEGALNPNVVLCRCAAGMAAMAKRHDRDSKEERRALLGTLDFLAELLRHEARNNGACALARTSIEEITTATGAVEALDAYLANFEGPPADSDFLKKRVAQHDAKACEWLSKVTGTELGPNATEWRRWIAKHRSRLTYDFRKGRFLGR